MAPDFLADQIERSLANLDIETIDVFDLHNPETQLAIVTPRGVRRAHPARRSPSWKDLVERQKIRWYGAATWEGFRKKDALSLPRMAEIAAEVGGPEHHFRFIQLPFNLGMVEAFVDQPESALAAAERLGIAAVASGTLMQGQMLSQMPDVVAELLPGLETDAQRAIQFTRSTPGISVALVGMSRAIMCWTTWAWRALLRFRASNTFGSINDGHRSAATGGALDAAIEALPNQPAVFLLWPREGAPYLSKTALLRRRLRRLLKEREKPSRMLNLRHTVARIEYRLTARRWKRRWCITNWRGGIFRRIIWSDQAADALVCEDRAHERVSAQPGDHPSRARRGLLRPVPFTGIGGAVRIAISGPVPDAPLPGGSDAVAGASGLHVWRDGDVSAPVPAGGWSGGVCA